MKNLLILVICFGNFAAMSQVTATWKGGFPGRESAWHCPQNWSTLRTPDYFNNVYIPDVTAQNGNFPIIEGDAGGVNALTIESGAKLTIAESGSLVVKMEESTVIIGDLVNRGSFMLLPMPPSTSKSRHPKNPLAFKAKQYNTMLSATDMLDGQ